jgi:hypothetical protein
MNDSAKENLRELLAGFMDAGSAKQTAEDIERGDVLLRQWSAPQPADVVLAEVKKKISAAVKQRHRIALQRRIWAVAGVAAAIVIVSALALTLSERQPAEKTTIKYAAAIPDRVWEGSDITKDDADIVVLVAEVETIENELSATRLDDTGGNGSTAVGDLETELIEIGGDFWKG